MADAYTSTALTDLVKVGYDKKAFFALLPEYFFSLTAGTRRMAVALTNPGTTITFTGYDELPVATTALTETTTPDSVAPTTSTKSVTLAEYGNVAKSTAKLRGASFMAPAIDSILAELIGRNAALSYDTLARNALVAGTNVIYPGAVASRVTVAAGTTITSAAIRKAVALMRAGNARGFGDMGVNTASFAGFIHPLVAVDLRQETDAGGWMIPVNYGQNQERRWNGLVGQYESVMFVETPRAPMFADAGVGSVVDVYATLIVGKEALSMAYSNVEHGPEPSFVVGPIVDALKRFHTLGWKWFGGFGIFRQEELYRIESSSSLGTNV